MWRRTWTGEPPRNRYRRTDQHEATRHVPDSSRPTDAGRQTSFLHREITRSRPLSVASEPPPPASIHASAAGGTQCPSPIGPGSYQSAEQAELCWIPAAAAPIRQTLAGAARETCGTPATTAMPARELSGPDPQPDLKLGLEDRVHGRAGFCASVAQNRPLMADPPGSARPARPDSTRVCKSSSC
jgi:hypothetical protein